MSWIISDNLTQLERTWWTVIEPLVRRCGEQRVCCFAIQSKKQNPLVCPGCHETFQFGDIRIETPRRNIAIEIESEGCGPINLLKYLLYIEAMARQEFEQKPLVLLHIFGTSYPTHRHIYNLIMKRVLASINTECPGLFQLCYYENDRPDREKDVLGKIKELLQEEGLLQEGEW